MRSTVDVADLQPLMVEPPKLAQAKLKVRAGTVPGKRGAGKEDTMKTSMLMKTVAALAVGAVPLGAFAAQPAKITTEQGVIQKVKAEKVKAPRKHYFAHNWLDS
jgi:hypothetical protein